jgi:hypothetical protein
MGALRQAIFAVAAAAGVAQGPAANVNQCNVYGAWINWKWPGLASRGSDAHTAPLPMQVRA